MPIKFKEKQFNNLNPQIILDRLEEVKEIKENGRVSYSAFVSMECQVVLNTMLEFPEDTPLYIRENIVQNTVFIAGKGSLKVDNFLLEANKEYKKYFSSEDKDYHLLTSISIKPPFFIDSFEIDGCKIIFLTGDYGSKYSSRSDAFEYIKDDQSKNYTKVIVKVKSNSVYKAADKGLEALNMFRFYLCLKLNDRQKIDFGSTANKPINKVILDKYHTLHFEDGSLASKQSWYNPIFNEINSTHIKKDSESSIGKDLDIFFERINKKGFKKYLKNSMLRFVQAYDHIDYHSVIINGWGALEYLVARNNLGSTNNQLISKRCSFLYQDREVQRQVLEHIRVYRNRNVHYGEASESPSVICHQLQKHFFGVIRFYLSNMDDFENIDKANMFLDLPDDSDQIEEKIKMMKKALKFIGPAN